ncbi:hypothetical protein SEA_LEROY_43 [Gordonia phage Leroy]|nr:hypothetical protein SEA_LEROY_43 [Gordonia phage Leroy]
MGASPEKHAQSWDNRKMTEQIGGMDQSLFMMKVLSGMHGGGKVTVHRLINEVEPACVCGWTLEDAPDLDEDAGLNEYFLAHLPPVKV